MKRKPRRNEGLASATTDAVATVLGNIAEALDRAEMNELSRAVRIDRLRLLHVLSRWMQAYEMRLVETERRAEQKKAESLAWQEEAEALRGSAKKLLPELAARDQEIARLRSQIARLEATTIRKGRGRVTR